MEKIYRPNVAAILQRADGKILLGERKGVKGCWQFPQGGVDAGENFEAAMLREVEEEIGVRPALLEIVNRKDGYRYAFPDGKTKFGIYHGQEQTYFLCRFLGVDSDINLKTASPEFQAFRWIEPWKYKFKWVPKFKRSVYKQVLEDFFHSHGSPDDSAENLDMDGDPTPAGGQEEWS